MESSQTRNSRPRLSTSELRELDRAHHIHPLTDHRALHQEGTHVIASGEGCFLTDSEGNRLLDAMAGLWCVNVGYSRREIVEAIREQMLRLPYYCSALNATTEPTLLLAEKLAGISPPYLKHFYFCSSGSEGNEAALKMIRLYHRLTGDSRRSKILTRRGSYHGGTLATTSMAGIPATYEPFGLPLAGFVNDCPTPHPYSAGSPLSPEEYGEWCVEETARILEREGPETVAAMFVEPVQAAGGVLVPPSGYLKQLRDLCRRQGILFVADEVVTGFGRLGEWFASQLYDLDPDFLVTAKAITSGYLPLSAVFVRDEIARVILQGGFFSHINTYSGHPAATAAALANLEILETEQLIPRTRQVTGPYFLERLRQFRDHPRVGEVRGAGLIGALELKPLHERPDLGPEVFRQYRQEGIIVRVVGNTIAFCPPLIVSEEEIDLIFSATQKVLDRLRG